MSGGHRQTVLGAFYPAPSPPDAGVLHEIPLGGLEDGDRLVSRFHAAPKSSNRTDTHSAPPLAILLHGLGGSMESNYIREFTVALLARGENVLRVNHRGVGEGIALAHGIYHSGSYPDLSAVVRYARANFPASSVSALGFSYSANLLLNQLGHLKTDLPDYTLAVSPPIDLARSASEMDHGFGLVYNQLFTRDLMLLVRLKRALDRFPKEIDLKGIRTLRDFDNRITAPLAGARDRLEYYHRFSSERVLDQITAPCAVLSSLDDPIIGGDHFEAAPWSASTRVRMEKHGGHLGFLSRGGKKLVDIGLSELDRLRAEFTPGYSA